MTAGMDGNRVWRIRTPAGPVLQKLYFPRKGALREAARALATSLVGAKTSPRAAARRQTEERLLRHWQAAGLDVPAVITPADVGLSAGAGLLMEDVPGPIVLDRLRRRTGLPAPERLDLLRRFGAAWGRRHRLALERADASLVQEHGSLAHVIECGERFVSIDLEQGWRAGAAVLPALAKEVAGVLRSLARVSPADAAEAELAALVDGYGDRELLTRIATEVLASPSPWRRFIRRLDRWREQVTGREHGTYAVVEGLAAALAADAP